MSDATPNGGAATAPNLTPRDLEILVHAFQSSKNGGEFEVDGEKLAQKLGSKSVNSARTLWGNVKKKLLGNTRVASPGGDSSVKSKTPRKKTAAATKQTPQVKNEVDVKTEVDIDDEETSVTASPEKGQSVAPDVNMPDAPPSDVLTPDPTPVSVKSSTVATNDGDAANDDVEADAPASPTPAQKNKKSTPAKAAAKKKATPKKSEKTITSTDDNEAEDEKPKATPKKRARAPKADDEANGDDANADKPTPKKARKTPVKKKTTTSDAAPAEGESAATAIDITTPKKKATPKSKGPTAAQKRKVAEEAAAAEDAARIAAEKARVQAEKDLEKAAANEANDVLTGKKKIVTDHAKDSAGAAATQGMIIDSVDGAAVKNGEAGAKVKTNGTEAVGGMAFNPINPDVNEDEDGDTIVVDTGNEDGEEGDIIVVNTGNQADDEEGDTIEVKV